MNKILILLASAILFLLADQTQAQDYFKERRYENTDLTKSSIRGYYTTISNERHEIVNKERKELLGKKLFFDEKQRIFYLKTDKKAIRFSETIAFMKYVGNKRSAETLRKSLTYYYTGLGTKFGGVLFATGGVLANILQIGIGEGVSTTGLIFIGTGTLMYGGGYFLNKKANSEVQRTLLYHNKNVHKFSEPVIAVNDFVPSGLGFKSVRMNLLNPTPIPTLSMSWNF